MQAISFGKIVFKKRKQDKKFQFDLIFGIFITFTCLFISRLFFIYFDFFLTELDSSKYYLFPNVVFWKIGIAISYIGISVLLLVSDKKLLNFRLKGIPFYMAIFGIIIVVIYPVASSEDFSTLSLLLFITVTPTALIPVIFIYIGLKTPEIRQGAFMIAFGLIIFSIAGAVINESLINQWTLAYGYQSRIIAYFLFITFKASGILLMSNGFKIFNIKLEDTKLASDNAAPTKWIERLGIDFTRPDNLTEKDIAFYREQVVCLVCKKELIAFSKVFYCPQCKALYCDNCAHVLSELENLCWSCDHPLDTSKKIKGTQHIEIGKQSLNAQKKVIDEESVHKVKKQKPS